jgi:hypothetical protein
LDDVFTSFVLTPDADPERPALPRPECGEPVRSFRMSASSSHLSQEIAALSDRFSELGERLLNSARQLLSPGVPPADDLLEALGRCRGEFFGLRDRVRHLAGSLELATPSDDQLQNLNDLNGLLDRVAEVEIRQSKVEESRRRSISVLDRVLSLTHASGPDFAPLREAHDRARELHSAIASAPWSDPHPEAAKLAEGDHHFADLLTLIQDRDEISDELWADLHENVSKNFGEAMATAAARAKLSFKVPEHSPDHGEPVHAGA